MKIVKKVNLYQQWKGGFVIDNNRLEVWNAAKFSVITSLWLQIKTTFLCRTSELTPPIQLELHIL